MVRAISADEVDKLESLIQKYVDHQIQEGVTSETVIDQMKSGIERESVQVVIEDDSNGVPLGFLIIKFGTDRLPILFANWNFEVERRLLDFAFNKLSKSASHISFESGWPTPWLSDELSEYAIRLGFVKVGRGYMRLQPIVIDLLIADSLDEEFEFIPFERSMVEEISKLVFTCVDGTVDQSLFPYVYGSIPKIEKFTYDLLDGIFGIHAPSYSWVLQENEKNIGACFLTTNENKGFVMHIVIHPQYRQQGLGRALLAHSMHSLIQHNPTITKFELALTLSNPAKRLYESLGFKILNDASTYVWQR